MHWFKVMRAFAAVPLGSTTDLQPLPTQRTTWHLPTPSRALLHETDVDPRGRCNAGRLQEQTQCCGSQDVKSSTHWRELPFARLEDKSTVKTFGHARAYYR